ncbi:MAG: pyridoxal-phosphate-dependent aminotransferase family protein [Wolinella sp.]
MLLFTPGPTPVPEPIRLSMGEPTIHHRTPEFEAIFARTQMLLKELLGMSEVLMLASSGTGAMEACVSSLCAKKALTINSGKFGERFGKIANALRIPSVEIKNEWDTPVSVEQILDVLRKDSDIDAIFVQICESAGGLRHPVEELARAVKAHNPSIMVVADAITAMGVEAIDTTHIDALIGGSQKAFMLPPGMSIVGLSSAAVEKIEARDVGYYFNMKTELKNQRKNTTAWTAPTTLVIGLGKYLEIAKERGFDVVFKETRARALATQESLRALGFSIFPKNPALAMTTIIDEERAEPLRKMLKKEFGVNIAGGQDHLKGKIFRINHMGLIELYESAWVINALELALNRIGARKFDGVGNRVFLEQYYAELAR